MNEPWHTVSHLWMSHVTRVIHAKTSCHTCECVMSQIVVLMIYMGLQGPEIMWHALMSHVTPCHMCEWVMSHMCTSHVTHCHWDYLHTLLGPEIMWHIFISHVTPCHTCECVISHMWTSHVTHMNASCHTCEWVMSHMRTSHITPCHTGERRNINWATMCDMARTHVWHDSLICVTWFQALGVCVDSPNDNVWHGSYTCVAWLIHACNMVWHDSLIRVTSFQALGVPCRYISHLYSYMKIWESCL